MKKFLLAIVGIVALMEQAKAKDFIEALGTECGNVLFHMSEYKYPGTYPDIIKRNTQFDALEKCLALYKQNGGDMQELNRRYFVADEISRCATINCVGKKSNNECGEEHMFVFERAIARNECGVYLMFKDVFQDCEFIEILKQKCEQ